MACAGNSTALRTGRLSRLVRLMSGLAALLFGLAAAAQSRAAPPAAPHPISYYADFGDDLISMFMDRDTGRWRPIEKSGFDAFFCRVQAHRLTRLIVWQSPFPYTADPQNYSAEDWRRYVEQSQAIIESKALDEAFSRQRGHNAWKWIRQLMALRLTPDFGPMLARSAAEHGIKLTASFRPFEPALSKYYGVPAFDGDGTFLWTFHPMASPAVNYHPQDCGFAHYRVILAALGRAAAGELGDIKISGVANAAAFLRRFAAKGDNLRIVAADFPPLQSDCFVLVRGAEGRFQLLPYQAIQRQAESRLRALSGFRVGHDADGSLRIGSLQAPSQLRYLILSNPAQAEEALDLPAAQPVTLWSRAGNPLGRENVWWVTSDPRTRVGGITATGAFHTDFQATEASGDLCWRGPPRRSLRCDQLVIDLGAPWSVEMLDFNGAAARRCAVAELKTILSRPAFDEILINSRSHTQLAAYLADGADGIQPRAAYRAAKKPFVHLGTDRAYAPQTAAAFVGDSTAKITTWQPEEWNGTCQRADSSFPWRYARNRAVASGVRRLLLDLERAFPQTRIRVVMPERAEATARIQRALEQMPKPGGGVYGRDYYRQLWASLNHIPAVGEGLAMVDLSGTRVEPMFLGIRSLPDMAPFELFVRECVADMADNHGSSFRGPRSFFYEGHETLRMKDAQAGRQGREERICRLLAQRGDINEVVLYESAAWLELPLSDSDLCSHGFIERCGELVGKHTQPRPTQPAIRTAP